MKGFLFLKVMTEIILRYLVFLKNVTFIEILTIFIRTPKSKLFNKISSDMFYLIASINSFRS